MLQVIRAQELGLAAQSLLADLFAVAPWLTPLAFWKPSEGGLQAPQQIMASPQSLPPLGFSQEKVLHLVGAQPVCQADCFCLPWSPEA